MEIALKKRKFQLSVNGSIRIVRAFPDEPLLWILREQLDLTGTKFSCGEGVCGACSVLIDNEPRRSCQIPVTSLSKENVITTIEGISSKGLSPLQQAFIDHTAFQCGFCTSGMIIAATALLRKHPNPTRKQIIAAMDNNLCRCGSHLNILAAIEAVAVKNI